MDGFVRRAHKKEPCEALGIPKPQSLTETGLLREVARYPEAAKTLGMKRIQDVHGPRTDRQFLLRDGNLASGVDVHDEGYGHGHLTKTLAALVDLLLRHLRVGRAHGLDDLLGKFRAMLALDHDVSPGPHLPVIRRSQPGREDAGDLLLVRSGRAQMIGRGPG